MEQKSIIQLVALGTFTFALGIITTLTIQSVVGSTPVQTSSSDASESSLVSSESLSIPPSSQERTEARFDDDITYPSPDDYDEVTGFSNQTLYSEIFDYVDNNFPESTSISRIYTISDRTFVYVNSEKPSEINLGSTIDDRFFLVFDDNNTILSTTPLYPSEAYQVSVETIYSNPAFYINELPVVYGEGVVFSIQYYQYVETNGIINYIDSHASWLRSLVGSTSYNTALAYFDVMTFDLHMLDNISQLEDANFSNDDLLVLGEHLYVSRSIYYDEMNEKYQEDPTEFDHYRSVAMLQQFTLAPSSHEPMIRIDQMYIGSNASVEIDVSSVRNRFAHLTTWNAYLNVEVFFYTNRGEFVNEALLVEDVFFGEIDIPHMDDLMDSAMFFGANINAEYRQTSVDLLIDLRTDDVVSSGLSLYEVSVVGENILEYRIQNVAYVATMDETIFSVISQVTFRETNMDDNRVEEFLEASNTIYEKTMFSEDGKVTDIVTEYPFFLYGVYTLENGDFVLFGITSNEAQNSDLQAYIYNDSFEEIDSIMLSFEENVVQIWDITLIDHVLYLEVYIEDPTGIFLTLESIYTDVQVFVVAINILFDSVV
jgi:hypothetical protein